MTIGLIVHMLAAVIWPAACSSLTWCCARRPGRSIPMRAWSCGPGVPTVLPLGVGVRRRPAAVRLRHGVPRARRVSRGAGVHVHVMQAIGSLMMVLFNPVVFCALAAPAPRARGGRRQDGGTPARADLLDGRNLALGLLTSAIGASGRYWGQGRRVQALPIWHGLLEGHSRAAQYARIASRSCRGGNRAHHKIPYLRG